MLPSNAPRIPMSLSPTPCLIACLLMLHSHDALLGPRSSLKLDTSPPITELFISSEALVSI